MKIKLFMTATIFLVVSSIMYSMDDPNFKKEDNSTSAKVIDDPAPSSGKPKKVPLLLFRTRTTKSISTGTHTPVGETVPKTPINKIDDFHAVIRKNKIAGQTARGP